MSSLLEITKLFANIYLLFYFVWTLVRYPRLRANLRLNFNEFKITVKVNKLSRPLKFA